MSPQASVRRGPTLRGGRFRPPIGRNSLIQRRNSTSSDEEEKLGLTENIELVNLSRPVIFFFINKQIRVKNLKQIKKKNHIIIMEKKHLETSSHIL